jgi:hypothetical protein
MQVPDTYYDEVFDFKGQWDVPSRCGLKILQQEKNIVIVTELYQDNPGTSVTAAGMSLAEQICLDKGLDLKEIVYLHCNPGTNSKLSFYDEEFYEVIFLDNAEISYRQLTAGEINKLLNPLPGRAD